MNLIDRWNKHNDEKEVKDREINGGKLAYHKGTKLKGDETNLFQKGWYAEQKVELKNLQKKEKIKKNNKKKSNTIF